MRAITDGNMELIKNVNCLIKFKETQNSMNLMIIFPLGNKWSNLFTRLSKGSQQTF